MKKSKKAVIIFAVLIAVTALCIGIFFAVRSVKKMKNPTTAEVKAFDIYVSPDGDDKGAGTLAEPVKTVDRARELVRLHNGEGDVTVHLSGTYYIDRAIEFQRRDGGQNGHSITYIGDNAVISGGRVIEGWSLHDADKNIYKAGNVDFDFAQLYVDGKRAVRAKSVPLDDPYSVRMIKAFREDTAVDGVTYPAYSVTVDSSLIGEWGNIKDVKLKTLMAWTDNTLPVESVEIIGNRGVVKIQQPASDRIFNRPHPDITGYSHEFTEDFICWFENAYEFIDEDGEWYLDKATDTLYYKAPKNADMSSVQVIAPAVEALISIRGTYDEPVENLSFQGITFCHSTWTRPNDEGLVCGQASNYIITTCLENKTTAYRTPSAVEVICGNNICFKSNVFENLGATGLDYFCGDRGGTVEGNIFRDIAGNGINIGKFVKDENEEYHNAYNPEDEREICDGQVICNNLITRTGADYEGSVGIGAGYPRNLTVENNTLCSMPYTGISVGFGWTGDDNAMKGNKILRNHIYDVNRAVCDGAAIYTLSKQPNSEIAYNYIHDFDRKPWFDYGCAGLYLDEQTEGYSVHDNVMVNCPEIWQNRNPKHGNSLKNNGPEVREDIIASAGIQKPYRHLLEEAK